MWDHCQLQRLKQPTERRIRGGTGERANGITLFFLERIICVKEFKQSTDYVDVRHFLSVMGHKHHIHPEKNVQKNLL